MIKPKVGQYWKSVLNCGFVITNLENDTIYYKMVLSYGKIKSDIKIYSMARDYWEEMHSENAWKLLKAYNSPLWKVMNE